MTLAMRTRACFSAAAGLGHEDTSRFIELHDQYLAAGASAVDAARSAAADLVAEIHGEADDLGKLIGTAPPAQPRAKVGDWIKLYSGKIVQVTDVDEKTVGYPLDKGTGATIHGGYTIVPEPSAAAAPTQTAPERWAEANVETRRAWLTQAGRTDLADKANVGQWAWNKLSQQVQRAIAKSAELDAVTSTALPDQVPHEPTDSLGARAAAMAERNKNAKVVEKLRATAQSTVDAGEAKLNQDRNTNTARRARMADGAEADARAAIFIGKKMLALADAIEAGDAPALVGITSRLGIEQLQSIKRQAMGEADRSAKLSYREEEARKGRAWEPRDASYIRYPTASWNSGELSSLTDALKGKKGGPALTKTIERSGGPTGEILSEARRILGEAKAKQVLGPWVAERVAGITRLQKAGIENTEQLKAAIEQYNALPAEGAKPDKVKQLERALVGIGKNGVGIDFFPTPPAVAERMVGTADIRAGMRVLEPSAGNGNIADAIRNVGVEPDVVEVSDRLREILEAKGHNLVGRDFMDYEPGAVYDRIVMNPPFGKGTAAEDAQHVQHAFDMLKPGGRLVAIVSEGLFGRSDKAATAFRDWLDEQGAENEKLAGGTFADVKQLASTGTATRIVTIDKQPSVAEERSVYQVNEPQENRDLFDFSPEPAPAAKKPQRPNTGPLDAERTKRGQLGLVPTSAPTQVLAVRPDQAMPGLYIISSQLVEVGTRELPVDKVTDWQSAATALGAMHRFAVEHFDMLITDAKGTPLAIVGGFKGATAATSVYPSTLLGEALRIKGAAHAWGVHNHPSGSSALSMADRFLSKTLRTSFEASRVRYEGLAAIGGGTLEWTAVDANGDEQGGKMLAGKAHTVPLVERTLEGQGTLAEKVNNPAEGKQIAARMAAGQPGIMFLSNQNQPSAWVPMDPDDAQTLRVNNRFDKLINAATQAGAASAILADPNGAFGARGVQNIGNALQRADVRLLDVIDTVAMTSAAEKGAVGPYGGPVLSIGSVEAPRVEMGGKPSAEAVAAVAQLADVLNTGGPDGGPLYTHAVQMEAVAPSDATDPAKAQELAAVTTIARRLFGHEAVLVEFAEGTKPAFGGAVLPELSGKVFLNVNVNKPLMAILGHELLHQLRIASPILYRDLQARLNEVIKDSDVYKAKLTALRARAGRELTENWVEELHADIVGDRFLEPEFWQQLAAAKKPGLFRRVVDAILKFLDGVATRIGAQHGFGTARFLSDVAEARAAVVSAMSGFNAKSFAGEKGDVLMAEQGRQEPFYSAFAEAVGRVSMKAGDAGAWSQFFKGLVANGKVKQDEINWSGVTDWIAMQGGKVSKADVQAYLADNGVRVTEKTYGNVARDAEAQDERARLNVELDNYTRNNGLPGMSAEELVEYLSEREEALKDADHEKSGDAEKIDQLITQRAWLLDFIDRWDAVEYADPDAEADAFGTKYRQYTLPGGENYRELLLTLPVESNAKAYEKAKADASYVRPTFQSNHWQGTPNVLAHIRMNERTDADGKRVLFIEEIQSDWAQQGKRKGFGPTMGTAYSVFNEHGQHMVTRTTRELAQRAIDEQNGRPLASNASGPADTSKWTIKEVEVKTKEGPPVAPFVGKTDAWVALALKRAIKVAVDEGFDRVALVNGQQSADRYSLEKQVNSIQWTGDRSGWKAVTIEPKGSNVIEFRVKPDGTVTGYGHRGAGEFEGRAIEDVVGKTIGKSILEESEGSVAGDGLKVGGEGMRAFYDQVVPNVAKEVVRKLGGGALVKTHLPGTWSYEQLKAAGNAIWPNRNLQERLTQAEQKAKVDAYLGAAPSSQQLAFDITPKMRAEAVAGVPLFSEPRLSMMDTLRRLDPKREQMASKTTRVHTPAQRAAMKHVGFITENVTMEERAKALWTDAGKKLAQGLVDQFAPIKDISKEAYGLARLSKGAAGAFETLLQGGMLKLTQGVYDFDASRKGGFAKRFLVPLQGEHQDVLRWIAANRAEQLTLEERENLFSAEDIAAFKTLADGVTSFDYTIQHGANKGLVTRDRTLIYPDATRTFNEFGRNVLDMAEQSGLIDGDKRAIWERDFYVPFYRVVGEAGDITGPDVKKGLVRQEAFKTLKGGTSKLNADLLDNALRNWSHLLDASAKNRAAKAAIEAAEQPGIAMATPLKAPGGEGTVFFREKGEKRYSMVHDPYFMTAVSSLGYAGMRSPVMNAMSFFKHALTEGVTRSPFFKVRNLIRDSVQSIATDTGLGLNPVANVAEGFKLTHRDADSHFQMLASGGTIHFGTLYEGNEAKRMQRLVDAGIDSTTVLDGDNKLKAFIRQVVKPAIDAYDELGNRGEEINRATLYAQLVRQGVGHAEAALRARDLMDFSMQGSFTSIRFLTQVVPFFNARIQGLYKLGRAGKEDPARLALVLGAAAALSIGLLAAYSDDDDWKKREDWDRNNYWWLKFGGTAFRIPKPFEIGAIATLAERSFELAFEKEMTLPRFRSQVIALAGDNLSMNPIPQMVKPILDVYANYDSFTNRPIETAGMERLAPDYRFNDQTSMTARAASTAANAITAPLGFASPSPVQIDHLIRGYFSWLGSFAIGAGDMIARLAVDKPAAPSPDYWKMASGGMVADLEGAPSRYLTQLYSQARAIEEAYGTWHELRQQGKFEEADNFEQAHRDEIAQYRTIERAKRVESTLGERARRIRESNASGDEKRQALRDVQQQRDAEARTVQP